MAYLGVIRVIRDISVRERGGKKIPVETGIRGGGGGVKGR
jgi:hypothetical protein